MDDEVSEENVERRPAKDCPFCGEQILAVAVKCKHCGEFLDVESRSPQPAPTQAVSASVASPAPRKPRGNRPKVTCPHCGVTGDVSTFVEKMKKGISGGKATAAVLTLGVSMLGTGLSRKEKVTRATCKNCGVSWMIG